MHDHFFFLFLWGSFFNYHIFSFIFSIAPMLLALYSDYMLISPSFHFVKCILKWESKIIFPLSVLSLFYFNLKQNYNKRYHCLENITFHHLQPQQCSLSNIVSILTVLTKCIASYFLSVFIFPFPSKVPSKNRFNFIFFLKWKSYSVSISSSIIPYFLWLL